MDICISKTGRKIFVKTKGGQKRPCVNPAFFFFFGFCCDN